VIHVRINKLAKQELDEPKLTAAKVKLLRPYFDRNSTSNYAAEKTGIARGTCQKYFKVWNEKLIEEMDDNFIRMQKGAKARGLIALDQLINAMRETLDELKILNDGHMKREKALWTKNKSHEIEINKWLTDKIQKYTKEIFNMEQVKVLIQMKPTADITLQLQIDEMLAKVKPEDLKQLMDDAKDSEGKKE